ncbi:glycerophosphodiester phosphodiesterase [Euzebya rosea]|uniref:glycerophosphodiester phosphodiesterase n=1 Tax=Euzebya rosea TaxID=2052804 RepID=UPI000D3E3E43|nr:glycerophosphodiester phosphodiesterase [Euzebya rosea]
MHDVTADPGPFDEVGFPSWVMGHRGARAVAPENSIEGFTWAIDNGLGSVEFDVRLTADGVLVCVHDESMAAHGGPSALVTELDAEAVDRVVLTTGVGVPRLEEVLDLAEGRLALNVEIKNDPRERSFDPRRAAAEVLADLLEDRASRGRADDVIAVSSFDAGTVGRFAEASSRFGHTAALLTSPGTTTQRIIDEGTALGVSAVHPHYSSLVSSSSCRRLQEAGFVVRTWTVNNRLVAQRLRRSGVAMIVTDDPRRIV